MPIYEYQCKSCQHEFEILQKMSADPLRECPDCGKEELKKKISAAAFRLKGGGWYETDFKTGDKKNLAASANKESSGSSSGSDSGSSSDSGKSDSKSSASTATSKSTTKSTTAPAS